MGHAKRVYDQRCLQQRLDVQIQQSVQNPVYLFHMLAGASIKGLWETCTHSHDQRNNNHARINLLPYSYTGS